MTVRGEGRKNGRGSHTIDLINAGTTDLKSTLRSVSVNGYEYAFPTEGDDPSYHRKLPRQSAFSKVRDSRSSLQRRPLGRPQFLVPPKGRTLAERPPFVLRSL